MYLIDIDDSGGRDVRRAAHVDARGALVAAGNAREATAVERDRVPERDVVADAEQPPRRAEGEDRRGAANLSAAGVARADARVPGLQIATEQERQTREAEQEDARGEQPHPPPHDPRPLPHARGL